MSEQNQVVLQQYAVGKYNPQILRYQWGEIPSVDECQVLVRALYL
jgi:hypothetical protein